MATFTVSFLSRDSNGQFKQFHRRLPAKDHDEVWSYIRHGERHGKWDVESAITVSRLNGETHQYGC